MDIEQIFEEGTGTVVDVRTPGEFMGGNVASSVNFPLNELQARLDEIKALKMPLIVCCASGMRSAQAAQFLSMHGLPCVNGGPWTQVNHYQSMFAKI